MLTAATLSENNHLSVAKVSVGGLSDVEGGIAVVEDWGRGSADCSSESRQEGEKAKGDHDVLKPGDVKQEKSVWMRLRVMRICPIRWDSQESL